MKHLKNIKKSYFSVMLAAAMFIACGDGKLRIVNVAFEDLQDAVLISGMTGCENLYLDNDSMRAYVTDLSGYLHLVNGETHETMEIETSIKIGNMGFGIDKGPDDNLYFSASEDSSESCVFGNCKYNAAIYRADMDLELPITKITEDYRGINGLTFDASGGCYFVSSDFTLFKPQGEIYLMQVAADGSVSPPEVFLANAGFANGLHYNKNQELIYLSKTTEGVFTFRRSEPFLQKVFTTFTDDLCTDKSGRVWTSGALYMSLLMYDQENRTVAIYAIEGFGDASSCRIREENGKEYIYITELNLPLQPGQRWTTTFDGRGIAIIPLDSLLSLL